MGMLEQDFGGGMPFFTKIQIGLEKTPWNLETSAAVVKFPPLYCSHGEKKIMISSLSTVDGSNGVGGNQGHAAVSPATFNSTTEFVVHQSLEIQQLKETFEQGFFNTIF